MIAKWSFGFPANCDSACIISGIYWSSFSYSVESSRSLKDLGRTDNIAPPVTVMVMMVLDSVVVLVLAVALT